MTFLIIVCGRHSYSPRPNFKNEQKVDRASDAQNLWLEGPGDGQGRSPPITLCHLKQQAQVWSNPHECSILPLQPTPEESSASAAALPWAERHLPDQLQGLLTTDHEDHRLA